MTHVAAKSKCMLHHDKFASGTVYITAYSLPWVTGFIYCDWDTLSKVHSIPVHFDVVLVGLSSRRGLVMQQPGDSRIPSPGMC